MSSHRVLAIAGVLLALATVFGAFGAHALKVQLTPERLQVYETGVRYHFFHALGLLGIGITLRFIDVPAVRGAAILIIAGIVLFSGSLYALTFGAPRPLGIVTPIGGLALIVGWVCFAAGVWRH
ncbi:MAG TPA: DUF423 domain-containing protein [Steroidobacteraceae bacterium]|nr:DUF423 domain-containing protein [Steroidobacteraceae bacterium]